ncbi:MAG: hypothetical protein HYZ86_01880 [Candidatus Omnitrophica bacterium]|nr:hypothetical protein [Candidatus Omnitrophota bacterium]
MFRHLHKITKGQNTAEYALLIALVVAGVIAMQTYVQRSLQAKTRDAGQYLTNSTTAKLSPSGITEVDQYEPYYQNTDYSITRDTAENKRQGQGLVAADSSSNRTRTGSQQSSYGETEGTGH